MIGSNFKSLAEVHPSEHHLEKNEWQIRLSLIFAVGSRTETSTDSGVFSDDVDFPVCLTLPNTFTVFQADITQQGKFLSFFFILQIPMNVRCADRLWTRKRHVTKL